MTAPVFVSHSSKDRASVLTLVSALEARGIACWVSSRDIPAGDNYGDAIVDAIEHAPAMVLVFSANANESDEIKKEIALASQRRITVVPARIEDVTPIKMFRYELATRNWIDVFPDWDEGVDKLVERLAGIVGAELPGPARSLPIPATARTNSASLIAAGTAVMVALVGATLFWVGRQTLAPPPYTTAAAAVPSPPAAARPPPAPAATEWASSPPRPTDALPAPKPIASINPQLTPRSIQTPSPFVDPVGPAPAVPSIVTAPVQPSPTPSTVAAADPSPGPSSTPSPAAAPDPTPPEAAVASTPPQPAAPTPPLPDASVAAAAPTPARAPADPAPTPSSTPSPAAASAPAEPSAVAARNRPPPDDSAADTPSAAVATEPRPSPSPSEAAIAPAHPEPAAQTRPSPIPSAAAASETSSSPRPSADPPVSTPSQTPAPYQVAIFVAPKPAAPSSSPALAAGPPAAAKGGEAFKDCEDCPEMVVAPAGKALLGSPRGEPGRDDRGEFDPHEVEFARPFAIGRYDVTFAEWDACVADDGCGKHRPGDMDFGRGRRPVIFVSWNDAQSYVDWLRLKTHQAYRLPSEAEWEYAARGCSRLDCEPKPFWFGAIAPENAVYDWQFSYRNSPKAFDVGHQTEPVDRGGPNPFGLFNILGDVRQWTMDCWLSPPPTPSRDGAPVLKGDCSERVTRGGSWHDKPGALRAAARNWASASDRSEPYIGFRVARDLAP